jgi:4-oxalocrotonate tautomerase
LQGAGAADRTGLTTHRAQCGEVEILARKKEPAMPFVNVKLIEGVFSQDQKQEMITRLTETMVDIEGEAMRPVTWVVLEEVNSGEWGIGGKGLTTQDVKDLQASK